MTSLLIGEDGNPIYHKRNWRMYAIYRLEHWGLRYVNNAEVTDDDIFEANQVQAVAHVICIIEHFVASSYIRNTLTL
jgi:hypothetical protein